MQTGHVVSGVGHGALILWAAVGGFFQPSAPPPVDFPEVTIISAAELDAFAARQPVSAEAPQALQPQDVLDAPLMRPQTDAISEQGVSKPPDQPRPDAAADLAVLLPPPVPSVAPDPPAPPPTPLLQPDAPVRPDANPAPAQRVAPTPSPAPSPDARPSQTVQEATTPDRRGQEVAAPTEAQAPEEATTRNTPEPAARAPVTSVRPASRPSRPTRTAESEPTPDPQAGNDVLADAINAAIQQANTPTAGPADFGPPLSANERDLLRRAIGGCWNFGRLSSEAMRVTIVVGLDMDPTARPILGSIRLISFEGGSQSAANVAFEAARSAIARCTGDGYPLPPDKFAQWQQVEITFNPERMQGR